MSEMADDEKSIKVVSTRVDLILDAALERVTYLAAKSSLAALQLARIRGPTAGHGELIETTSIWPCNLIVWIEQRSGVARIGRRCSWG